MERSARRVINIQSLQGACRLDGAADSAVLYGTLRETVGINTTRGILYSHILLRSMISWGDVNPEININPKMWIYTCILELCGSSAVIFDIVMQCRLVVQIILLLWDLCTLDCDEDCGVEFWPRSASILRVSSVPQREKNKWKDQQHLCCCCCFYTRFLFSSRATTCFRFNTW